MHFHTLNGKKISNETKMAIATPNIILFVLNLIWTRWRSYKNTAHQLQRKKWNDRRIYGVNLHVQIARIPPEPDRSLENRPEFQKCRTGWLESGFGRAGGWPVDLHHNSPKASQVPLLEPLARVFPDVTKARKYRDFWDSGSVGHSCLVGHSGRGPDWHL